MRKCEIATWHCDCVVLLYRYCTGTVLMRAGCGLLHTSLHRCINFSSWNYKHKHYIMVRGLCGCYGTVLYGASINTDIDMRWVGGGVALLGRS